MLIVVAVVLAGCTGVLGDVVVTTDDEAVTVETAEEGPTDAAAILEEKRGDETYLAGFCSQFPRG